MQSSVGSKSAKVFSCHSSSASAVYLRCTSLCKFVVNVLFDNVGIPSRSAGTGRFAWSRAEVQIKNQETELILKLRARSYAIFSTAPPLCN